MFRGLVSRSGSKPYLLLLTILIIILSLTILSLSQQTERREVVIVIPKAVSHMPYSSTFWPSSVKVVIGVNNTVRWVNMDDHMHTVTAMDWEFNSGELNLYDDFTYVFTKAGRYRYRCLPHPWMVSVVEVYEP